mmetsp:Transcript_22484/g.25131  ORF Transcript_22484/g.25131 Transcript_22484/m.25131 type:complete len:100 (+) Transcript_22484:1241-1540(+)
MIGEDATANYDNPNEDNHDESAMIMNALPEAIKTVSKPKIILLKIEQPLREVQAYIVQPNAPKENTNVYLQLSNHLRAHNASLPRMNPTITSFSKKNYI